MTTGELLATSSTVYDVSALEHLLHLKKEECNTFMTDDIKLKIEEAARLVSKDDIIRLKEIVDTIGLDSKTETKLELEDNYGLRESCTKV